MPVKVRIPTPLQNLVGNQSDVSCEASNVGELINNLDASYPGIKARICDEGGSIRRFVNIYKNGEDIRFADGEQTSLGDGDEVSIIPAIAGGY